MKLSIAALLFTVLSFGQAPTAQPASPLGPPTMIPGAPAPVPPDAVVIDVGGKKYTAAEVDKIVGALPPQYQPAIRSNPKNIMQIFIYRELERMARADKLDQQSPIKEQLEFLQTQYLAQQEMNNYRYTKIKITEEDQQKYYQAHSGDKFREAKVRVIYLAFRPANPQTDDQKKLPVEADAKTKAEDLRKQLQNGADFAALAKANSNDKASAEIGGDYGIINQDSSSDALKKVSFSLKPGEISEPVRQPNGFYLVRVDQFITRPFDQVQGIIDENIRNEKFNTFMLDMQTKNAVKVENPNYFAPRPMPAGMLQQQPAPTRPPVPPGAK
jgi:peptidyl-prolyl cis-trans isomerase C